MASKRNQSKAFNDARKAIIDNMKCPVCMEVLLPPIYQCETGHNICYLCVDEVTECPLCKGDYGDTRNYFAEELVNSMSFPCKFEDYGCTKILPGSELKDHQDSCELQPYRCPELACQEVAGLHQMGKHLDRHGFKVMKGDVQQASIDIQDDHFDRKTEYNPWRIYAFNREFYTVSTRQKDGCWYFWSYCLGLPKDTKKFSYEILVFCEDKQFILYRGLVHSLRIEPDDIMSQGNCLTLTDSVVKGLRKNGKITCRVRFIQGRNWEIEKPKKPAVVAKAAAKNQKMNSYKGKVRIPSSTTGPSTSASPSDSLSPLTPLRVLKAKMTRSPTIPLPAPTTPVAKCSTTKEIAAVVTTSRTFKKPNHRPIKITDEEHNFVTKMRETLRCPGCNEVIEPPVSQCLLGHNVCYSCKTSRSDCAVCRAPIGSSRNFFAEELLYKVYQRCSFATKGCQVVLPSAQMRLHESSCDFAPFECPFNACRQLVGPKDVFTHLKSHQITVKNNEINTQIEVPKTLPSLGPVCTIPHILWKNNTAFYPTILRHPEGTWMFSVSTQEPSKYRYEVTLVKMSKTLSFQGPVLSLRMNQTQIDQSGLALVMPENMVNSLKYDGKLSYCINVFATSERIPAYSMFAFNECLKLESRRSAGQMELFANKKTSVSAEDSEGEVDEALAIDGDDSETRLSELYEAESYEILDEGEFEVKETDGTLCIFESECEPGKEIEEIKSVTQSLGSQILNDNPVEASRVNSELETMIKSGPPAATSVHRENKLSVVASELVGQNKKQQQQGARKKRSKSRQKTQSGQSSSSTTVRNCTKEEPNKCTKKTAETLIKADEGITETGIHNNNNASSHNLCCSSSKEAIKVKGVPQKAKMSKKCAITKTIGTGENDVHNSVIIPQTIEKMQEVHQELDVSSVQDMQYYDMAWKTETENGSKLFVQNVDTVVEMINDGFEEITEVISDGLNAVKNVVDKVDMETIADGFNAVKSVVDLVGGRVGRHILEEIENEPDKEEEADKMNQSQTSIDPEVD